MANETDFSTEARNFLEDNMIEQSQMQLELLRRQQLNNKSFNCISPVSPVAFSAINQHQNHINNISASNNIGHNIGCSSNILSVSNMIGSSFPSNIGCTSNSSAGSSFSDNSQEGANMSNNRSNNSTIAAMIEEVKNYPCIWNISSTDFKDRSKKEESWKRIAAQLRSDGELCYIFLYCSALLVISVLIMNLWLINSIVW